MCRVDHPGVTVADSAAAVGAAADVVITMLPDGHEVQHVALGPGGLAETMGSGSLLLDTSSAQPWLTLETAARAGRARRRRWSTRRSPAPSGAPSRPSWSSWSAGATHDLERVRPILDLLGRAVFHLGPLGSGHVMKCINNTITAMTLLATVEGLVLGKRAGLDPVAINAVLNESTGGSWVTRNHTEQRILSRTFDDPFKLELMTKDIGIATQLARDLGLDASLRRAVRSPVPGGERRSGSRPEPQRARAMGRAAHAGGHHTW